MGWRDRSQQATAFNTSNVWIAGDSMASFANESLATEQLSVGAQSTLFHLNNFLGGALYQVGNTGTSGAGIEDLLNNQLPKIITARTTKRIDFVLVTVTANDFYLSSLTYTAEKVKSLMTSFLRRMAEEAIPVVLLNGIARAVGDVSTNLYTLAQVEQQKLYVAWVNTKLPSLFPQVTVIDSYSLATDSSGYALAGFTYDGLHANAHYSRLIARSIYSKLKSKVNPTLSHRVMSTSDIFGGGTQSRNIMTGSALGGTIGQTSLLSGWAVASSTNVTPTYLVKANPNGGAGNQLEVTLPFTAAGFYAVQVTETFTADARIISTDKFYPSAIVSAIQASPNLIKDVYIRGSVSDGTTPWYSYGGYSRGSDAAGKGYQDDISDEVLLGAPQQSIVNSTSCVFQISVRSLGAGTITLRFAEPAIWRAFNNDFDRPGTTTNDSSAAGQVGELLTASATGVALSTGVTANLTSVSLTAGDWDVTAVAQYTPAATTSITELTQGINSTSATIGALGSFSRFVTPAAVPGATPSAWPVSTVRMTLAATTTVYLSSNSVFTVSTLTGAGLIRARRVR